MRTNLRLMTVKKAMTETGASRSFLKQLVREGKLRRYGVNRAIYISLTEFEKLVSERAQKKVIKN